MSHEHLSHIDASGKARMVDVGAKEPTARMAIASGRVRINAALEAAIRENTVAKGDVLSVARIAGITAAKRTDQLIPLCHTLPVDFVDVEARLVDGAVELRAEVRTTARTGVEMEALTAVAVAALTVVDMGKALDRAMQIEDVRVLEKRGGRSGTFIAENAS